MGKIFHQSLLLTLNFKHLDSKIMKKISGILSHPVCGHFHGNSKELIQTLVKRLITCCLFVIECKQSARTSGIMKYKDCLKSNELLSLNAEINYEISAYRNKFSI